MASGGIRPGEVQSDPNPFYGQYYSDVVKSTNSTTNGLQTSDLAANDYSRSFLDPILLDLNGQGIKTTSESTNPVYFDADNSGTLKQTAWTADGNTGILVVPDSSGNVTNISQLFSEYYGGDVGTGGEPGYEEYTSGFDALHSVDNNFDGKLNSTDSIWTSLRVWQDANHNAKVDSGELKTMAQLGITQFNIIPTSSSDVLNGNPVTALGSFVINGQTRTLADVNLVHSDVSHTLSTSGTGQIDTSVKTNADGTKTTSKTYIELETANKTLNASTLAVDNITGGNGSDSLQASSVGSWLQGNGGSNTYIGGTGNDVFVVSASDNPDNITGNGGQDQLIITGNAGMVINMAQGGVEIAQGGSGDDVIMSGGRTGVYIKGGTGTDILIGGAGNDVIVGGTGHNTIIGGTGQSIIYAGPNGDLIYGAAKSSIISAGGGEDTIIAGAGDDLIKVGMGNAQIDGGDGTNLLQFHGSYGDYKIVKTADGYVISDRIPNRDGTVFIKNIQKLNFSDIQAVSLTSTSPMPVADLLTKDKNGITFDHTQSHTISAASLLANDQVLGSTTPLTISTVDPYSVIGGTATLNANGDVVFTPDADYKGMMSFKYTVVDSAGHSAATIVDNATGQNATLYARVTLATPDLPTDPLISKEWYLNDTNIIPVWDDYTGKGIRIGQFEPGGEFALGAEVLNYNHPDLQANIDPAWLTYQEYSGTLPTQYSAHATLVAGIIAASKNGTGSVGVAYDSTIAGYNLIQDNPLANLNYASDFDVVNNSFLFRPDFAYSDTTSSTTNPGNLMAAIQLNAEMYGRGGKGTVVVTVAGNDRATGGSAQGSTYNRSRFAIEVGAINQQADLSTLNLPPLTPYSNPGSSILVSAPGSNITNTSQLVVTDQGSIYGSNYETSQGTSFATPIVSGIAALMLQANPNLGYRDVQAILALSAKKIADSSTSWNYNRSGNWNGSGMHFSYDYGFGEVDALAAVRLAETWIPHSIQSNELVRSAISSSVVSIAAGQSTTQSVTVTSGVKVEHAEIDLSLSYGHLKDITATLISPNLTSSILLKANDPSDTSTSLQYTFMSTSNWGEQSGGTWQLLLQDASTGQSITLNNWALRLYGSASSTDDIYYYTNEYAAQVTRIASAATLSDSSGKNTINAAAVTGDSSINLSTGASSIGGTGLTISTPGNFNNIFTGDGNDTLTANSNLGILDGGRGNNTLTGGTGQNLFVVHERSNGLDTIYNFNASNESIDLVGFIGKNYSNLAITQQGADTWIGLGNGQKIVLKGITASTISSGLLKFQDTFVAPKMYTDSSSTDNTFVGSSSTIIMTGTAGRSLTSNDQHQLIYIYPPSSSSPPYAHDMATSDRFVVSPTSNDGLSEILGFKSGVDKLDLTQLGIISQSDLVLYAASGVKVNDGQFSHGVNVFSLSLQKYLVYFDSMNPSQLKGSDVIFYSAQTPNGVVGDGNIVLRIGTPPSSGTPPLDTNGSSDPAIIGSNSGITFNGTTSVTSSVNYTLPDTINTLILTGTNNLVGVANNHGDSITSNTGIDTLVGGAGNDTYIIKNSADQIIENTNGGTDSVQSSVSFTLDSNVENLTLTGTASLLAVGNSSNNIITGTNGNDTYDAGGGNDSLVTGTGNDTYIYTSGWGSDTISDAGGNNTLDLTANTSSLQINLTATTGDHTNSASSDLIWSGEVIQNVYKGIGNDLLTGTSVANYLSPGAGNDTITAGAGNDTLDGGLGNDSLVGETGDDLYIVDSSSDIVVENASEGIDTVQSSVNYTLGANFENLTLTGFENLVGTGNSAANTIIGNSGNDTFNALGGNDSLSGSTGNDTYLYTSGWGSDTISDAGGNNTLDLSANISGLQIDLTAKSTDHTNSASSDLFWAGEIIQNVYKGAGNDLITGTSVANYLSSGAGNDTIIAGAGNDTLDGGLNNDSLVGGIGDDLYIVDSLSDILVENAGEGTDTIKSSTSYALATNFENLTLIGTSNSTATGNSVANTLIGNNGNDTFDAGGGNDSLSGGTGNDTYLYSSGWGSDTISDAGGNNSLDLSANSSNLQINLTATTADHTNSASSDIFWTGEIIQNVYKGIGDDVITGTSVANYISSGAGNDSITGAGGNDTLDGGVGNDTLIGGTGDDLYSVDSTADAITENASEGTDTVQSTASFTLSANVENLTLTGSDDLSGSGNSGANIITGNNGNDTLFGASGNDSLIGGTGNDSYLYTSGWGSDTVSDAGGNNTLDFSNYNSSLQISLVATSADHTNSASSDLFWSGGIFQNILKGVGDDVLTGTSVDNNLSGGGGNDTINAGAGNDTLDGGAGNDSLVGGTGSDLYLVDTAADIIVENAIEGNDTVQSSATYTLSANVENLTLTGSSAISGGGNTSDNVLLGNTGANMLSGMAGNDTLDGVTGADTLKGGAGNDKYIFSLGDGVDSVQEVDSTAGNSDTLSFDASVIKANIALFMSGNDLQIGYKNNATDQITVVNQQLASGSIERFQANDGTILTNADVNLVIQQMSSYATANSVSFTSLSDVENNTNLMAIVNGAWHAA
jgi:Ca2+-binding RTX toxin-like protein/subtilisin-like proprotein convertase family protein